MPANPSPFERAAGQAAQAGSHGSETSGQRAPLLSTLEARRLIWELVPLVDARSASDYLSYHLPGAIHLPDDAQPDLISRVLPEPHKPLILYSNTIQRATTLAGQLLDLGYINVFIFNGGLTNLLALQDA